MLRSSHEPASSPRVRVKRYAIVGSAGYPVGNMTEVHDSPAGWVADHIKSYVESDGEQGHVWHGVPTLLLTTKGRKTGELLRTALIYGEHDGTYLLVASQGGAPTHPPGT